MGDSVQRVTRQSWGSRLGGAFSGVIIGLALSVGGVVLLFWNEGRAVKRYQTLKEGAAAVVSVGSQRVDAENQGRLVHTSGRATTEEILRDDRFGVEAAALKLRRRVEMYQWVEHTRSEERQKLGGGTETVTTYSYEKEWTDREVDSGSFEDPGGHQNPSFPVRGEEWRAQRVDLGAFQLGDSLVRQIGRETALAVSEDVALRAEEELDRWVVVADGGLYAGSSPPEIGDLRINYHTVQPAEVSVVGAQTGERLESYATRAGGTIALLDYGVVDAPQMFQAAQTQNRILAWILRAAGMLLLWIGFGTVLRPVRVFADVVPLFGRLVGAGLGVVAFVGAVLVGLVVIAIGWLFYRPLLALALIAVALGLLVWLLRRGRKRTPALPPLPVPKGTQ